MAYPYTQTILFLLLGIGNIYLYCDQTFEELSRPGCGFRVVSRNGQTIAAANPNRFWKARRLWPFGL